MKILMFAPIFPPMIGGPATQSFSLCRALFEHGEQVVVLTPGARFSFARPDGYPVYRYRWQYTRTGLDKPLRWIVFTVVFLFVMLRERPQILHVHSVSAPSFIAAGIAKLWGIPSIVKFAGDWVWETLSTSGVKGKEFEDLYTGSLWGRFLLRVERFGVSLFTIVWTPSQFRRQNVIDLLGTDEKVRIIPNSLLLPPGGVREQTADEEVIVVSANRFIPHKRIPTIVRAFATMNIPNSRLILIGGGQEAERVATVAEIARLGLEGRVILTGLLSSQEIYEHFQKATLYVSASLEEGFPNVFIEAMHFGLPIVSTDVGGCKELVEEGVTGFLVPPENEDALADRMRQIAVNPSLRNTLAAAALQSSKQYNLETVLARFLELYRTLLTKH